MGPSEDHPQFRIARNMILGTQRLLAFGEPRQTWATPVFGPADPTLWDCGWVLFDLVKVLKCFSPEALRDCQDELRTVVHCYIAAGTHNIHQKAYFDHPQFSATTGEKWTQCSEQCALVNTLVPGLISVEVIQAMRDLTQETVENRCVRGCYHEMH